MRLRVNRSTTLVLLALLTSGCGSDGPIAGPGGNNPPGNRAPHIDPIDEQMVNEGELLTLVFAVSDPDGDLLYVEAENVPEGAFFDPSQGIFTYDPDHDLARGGGSITLPAMTVTVDDNYLSDSIDVVITVFDVNREPFFLSSDSGPLSALEAQLDPDTEGRLTFQAIDPDEDELTLRLDGSPVYASLDGNAILLQPTSADVGTEDFTLIADDGQATASVPVNVIVGDIAAELPAPSGLVQSTIETGPVAAGGDLYEGSVTFKGDPHTFAHGDLRFQVELAEVGENWEDGTRATSDVLRSGEQPSVDMSLAGGLSYRWRARWLSEEFGAGPYASFGANADSEADLVVTIVPETSLDETPNDPSPVDVLFGFSSPNVTDFECQMDTADWVDCGDASPAQKNYLGLSQGAHTFRVRAVTRDGTPDPSPEEYSWEVLDVAEPNTSFSSSPAATTTCAAADNGTLSFFFSSDLHPSVSYECRLSKTGLGGFTGTYVPCVSPKEYQGITNGNWTFEVRAINLADVPDPTPATHNFNSNCN